MANGRKKSTSQHPHDHHGHLPKVGSKRQTAWDRRTRLDDLEFDMAWVVAAIVLITLLAVIAFVIR